MRDRWNRGRRSQSRYRIKAAEEEEEEEKEEEMEEGKEVVVKGEEEAKDKCHPEYEKRKSLKTMMKVDRHQRRESGSGKARSQDGEPK